MTDPEKMLLNDALAGKHGPEIKGKAEQAVDAAVAQIARMVGTGEIAGDAAKKFASGGLVSPNATFMVGNGDREHYMPVSIGFDPKAVVDASAWRPQDCAPILRRYMFRDKQ